MPIMATSVMQMAFNLADMFWLSNMEGGTGAVAAAGTAGMYLWLSMSLIFIGRMGAEIGVSQNIGKGDIAAAKSFAQQSLMLSVVLGVLYAIAMVVFRGPLIAIFRIDDAQVVLQSEQYLAFTAIALPFIFAHHVITGCFNGFGNTKLPFYVNSVCLALNIAITPIFIFALNMGIIGAAVGTIIASVANLALKLWALKRYSGRPFESFKFFTAFDKNRIRQIFKWGLPVAAESSLFTVFYMIVSILVASFGVYAIAAQRVGTQIESLGWMMSGGFASAVTAFVGQNYGAKKFGRLARGYKISIIAMAIYGAFVTFVLFVFAEPLVSLFLTEPPAIEIGVTLLRILALLQILGCMEGVAAGAFRGKGLTMKPTIVSVSSNGIRVILCYALASTALGLDGIWYGIAIAVVIRGLWLLTWYYINARKFPAVDEEVR